MGDVATVAVMRIDTRTHHSQAPRHGSPIPTRTRAVTGEVLYYKPVTAFRARDLAPQPHTRSSPQRCAAAMVNFTALNFPWQAKPPPLAVAPTFAEPPPIALALFWLLPVVLCITHGSIGIGRLVPKKLFSHEDSTNVANAHDTLTSSAPTWGGCRTLCSTCADVPSLPCNTDSQAARLRVPASFRRPLRLAALRYGFHWLAAHPRMHLDACRSLRLLDHLPHPKGTDQGGQSHLARVPVALDRLRLSLACVHVDRLVRGTLRQRPALPRQRRVCEFHVHATAAALRTMWKAPATLSTGCGNLRDVDRRGHLDQLR